MTLTDEGRRLVDDARAGYGPTPSDRERVLSALAARVAAAGAAAAASSGGSAAASASGVAAVKATIVGIVAVAVVTVGAVSVRTWRSGHDVAVTSPPVSPAVVRAPAPALAPTASAPLPSSAPAEMARERPHRARAEPARGEAPFPPRALRAATRSPAPLTAAPLAAAPEPRPEPAAEPRADVVPETRPDAAAETRPDVVARPRPDVAGEVALLARAQKALADGDFRRCLRLLERHEAAFPHGTLTEERAAARIIALCGLDRVETARQEIATFLSKAPASPLAERVRHACGTAWPVSPSAPR